MWVLRNLGDWAANVTVIAGPSGLIVYDSGVNTAHGGLIKEAIANISGKPIVAVISSHHHADHVGGASALVNADAVKTG